MKLALFWNYQSGRIQLGRLTMPFPRSSKFVRPFCCCTAVVLFETDWIRLLRLIVTNFLSFSLLLNVDFFYTNVAKKRRRQDSSNIQQARISEHLVSCSSVALYVSGQIRGFGRALLQLNLCCLAASRRELCRNLRLGKRMRGFSISRPPVIPTRLQDL